MEESAKKNKHKPVNERAGYMILLVMALLFVVISFVMKEYEGMLVSVPTIIVVAVFLVRNGRFYVPPALIVLMSVVLLLFMIAKYSVKIQNELIFGGVADLMMGAFLGLIGLIVVYTMLRSMPNFDKDNAFFVSLSAFCIGVSLSVIILLLNYTIVSFQNESGLEYSAPFIAVREVLMVIAGSGFVNILFYLNRHNGLFKHTLEKFLSENADTLGIEDQEIRNIEKIIETGETSVIELKSTIRTNLKTGEKDPRMEKAVLKTLVAFLNSKGGTLLIGVADDGTVIGVDEDSFENRDKMMLHLNNLIKTQIGGEFLPYITYRAFDMDGKTIIKIDCSRSESPVFLKEGKVETFFVRSGPSSIDLHGTDMLAYANHNFGSQLRKVYNKIK